MKNQSIDWWNLVAHSNRLAFSPSSSGGAHWQEPNGKRTLVGSPAEPSSIRLLPAAHTFTPNRPIARSLVCLRQVGEPGLIIRGECQPALNITSSLSLLLRDCGRESFIDFAELYRGAVARSRGRKNIYSTKDAYFCSLGMVTKDAFWKFKNKGSHYSNWIITRRLSYGKSNVHELWRKISLQHRYKDT